MQQVLILPKNFVIQHKEGKQLQKEIPPLQQKGTEQHGSPFPQTAKCKLSFLYHQFLSTQQELFLHNYLIQLSTRQLPLRQNVSSARPQSLTPVTSHK